MNVQLVNFAGEWETGKLGIYYLKRIWSSYMLQRQNGAVNDAETVEWKYLIAVFNTLGLGLEPTLKYLYSTSQSFEEFENWILKNGVVSRDIISHFNSVVKKSAEADFDDSQEAISQSVLDEKDLKFWEENGYVVIKNAISNEACEQTKSVIYDFIYADENDPATWYRDHDAKQGIMVQLFNSEVLNKNRLSERIKSAYYQLWNRKDLLVSMDRVSFNPPETDSYQFPGPNLHWDVSLKQPIPFGLQGLLYLTDTSSEQGAFTLVPGFHNSIGNWLDNLPAGTNPRTYDFDLLNPRPIEGKAGDFIIWHQALPHGSAPNRTRKPRIVQYINYQPIEMEGHEEWI